MYNIVVLTASNGRPGCPTIMYNSLPLTAASASGPYAIGCGKKPDAPPRSVTGLDRAIVNGGRPL